MQRFRIITECVSTAGPRSADETGEIGAADDVATSAALTSLAPVSGLA